MKFHKFIITAIILSITVSSYSQYKRIIRGTKQYDNLLFRKAIRTLEKVDDKTIDVNRLLADSYFKTNNYLKAEEMYEKVTLQRNRTPEDLFSYASILLMNKKYEQAEKVFIELSDVQTEDGRLIAKKENVAYYLDLLKDREKYKIKNLDINTEEEDFSPSYYQGDKLVFTSSREGITPIKRRWNRNGLSWLDLYVSQIDNGNKEISEIKQFNEKDNFKFHDGPATFNWKGDYMVFTRNNYGKKGEDGVMGLQLFETTHDGKKWDKPSSLHFNSSDYSVGQATLTEDGNTMYFTSDMPGGFGGTDIYSVKKENGKWGKPKNLGNKVNTEGNEMFPFVHFNREMLFFASDGHLGLGGLDVFVLQLKDDYQSDIKNVGVPINSSKDDFSFILADDKKTGYFTSNREEGKGNDDIYSFDVLKPISLGRKVIGIVRDEFGEILPESKVVLLDSDRNIIDKFNTGDKGEYEFSVVPNSNYTLYGSKENYFIETVDVNTDGDKDIITTEIMLFRILDVSLNGIVTDNENQGLLSDVIVTITDNSDGKVDTLVTDYKGEYNLDYGGKKINTSLDFSIRLEKEGYLSKTIEFQELVKDVGFYDLKTGMDKVKVGVDVAKLLNLNPIYFDFGKFNIRPDAALELDKMVQVLMDNTGIEIELGAHTDCRGNDKTNNKLSQKRAKASADYIKKRIDDPSRIYGKGFGESMPVVDCGCSECTEEEHQLNRRTEFKVVKINN